MNRFAELNAKADFGKDIKMEYASVLRVGGTGEAATIHADSVTMRYGAVMEFDLYSENTQADRIVLTKGLSLETLNRSDGPSLSKREKRDGSRKIPHRRSEKDRRQRR